MVLPQRRCCPQFLLPAFRRRASGALLALGLLAAPVAALAQEAPPPLQTTTPLEIREGEKIGFEADGASYDDNSDQVSVFGNVVLRRGEQSVRADKVTWDRKTGQILAEGNIRFVDVDGNQLFTDRLELTDELKAGAMQNMLYVLREGGRLAAQSGERGDNGQVILHNAAYSACAVEDSQGCPRQPSWRLTAKRVVFDPDSKTVRFYGSRIELFGVSLLPMPTIALATDGRPISGLLIPDVQLSASNGVQISDTWYQRLGPNRELSVTGYVFTKALPMVSAQFRHLTGNGAYQVTGYATRSSRIPIGSSSTVTQKDFRGYFYTNGHFQFSPNWGLTFSSRLASDRTFLRRYDISRDDRLRSTVDLERIDPDSYLSISGWATQTLRVGDSQGLVPFAVPVIDYRRRLADPVLGGRIQLQANSMAITRTSGQDTQRAFASAQWDLRRITPMGQELTLTALARGDIYHSDENALTSTVIYRGDPGWQARAMATVAFDAKWPLVGSFLGGTQVLTPRFQVVASPTLRNLAVPNEDARAIDLEDSNLFALNRFPGYDRIEDGVRFTYGFDWQFERPGWRISTTVGQSYRLTDRPTLLPDGTGLSTRTSDIVGRTEVRYRDFVKFTHRFRLDKDNFAVRRNEFDAAIGTRRTYLELGYLRLNRDVSSGIEDLKDREEARIAGRVGFARYWSIFGSGVFDLTGNSDDPTLVGVDGFQPIRTRLGVAYQDDCLEIDVTWRRDYVATGDARRGNTFQIHIALRNLGFR
ncbi:LPS assembly protein LptD [Novosphingobium sp.]|uniref:LPS-assembly protein LptD n=1 Tax=Novosphingobium sp. TaxID=1874826 RepID=UPI0025E9DF26|nr:LPS assembly protein LptD [Novosphingobium sp.]MCC6925320.1 LPS-assembly protein LptD [Novosphingobium sp.]